MDLARTKVTIDSASTIKALVVLAAAYALYLLRDVVLIVLTSVVIASAIEPATRWLSARRIPRLFGVIFIYAATVLLLIGLLYVFVPSILRDLSDLSFDLPRWLSSIELLNPLDSSSLSALTGPFDLSLESLSGDLRDLIIKLPKGFFQTASLIFGGFFSFILIIVLSFYLAVQKDGIENFLRIIVPTPREKYVIDLWRRAQKKIGLWMQGQLLLGLLIGILVYLGLTILQVRYALVLAVLAAMFELIPLFGPVLAAVPAVILAFSNSVTVGLMTIGLYLILQQFENHLIYPLVVKKIVGIHPLIVIIALIVGGKLAGFLGLLISVPLAVVAMELVDDIEKQKTLSGQSAA